MKKNKKLNKMKRGRTLVKWSEGENEQKREKTQEEHTDE